MHSDSSLHSNSSSLSQHPDWESYHNHPIVNKAADDFCEPFLSGTSSEMGDAVVYAFCILFAISVAGLIFIATTIMFNQKLQTHPQPMIAWICIAEACMSYNALLEVINPVTFICYFSTYRILGYTLFHSGDEDAEKYANK